MNVSAKPEFWEVELMITAQEHILEETSQLTLAELRNVSEKLQEEIREREWDEIWERTLASEESIAYQEQVYKRMQESIAKGEEWLTLEDLEKLCHEDADE
jgi:hypothetical protein